MCTWFSVGKLYINGIPSWEDHIIPYNGILTIVFAHIVPGIAYAEGAPTCFTLIYYGWVERSHVSSDIFLGQGQFRGHLRWATARGSDPRMPNRELSNNLH